MPERIGRQKDSFFTPEQRRERIRMSELKKDWEERSLPNSRAQQAENNFRETINPRAEQAKEELARIKAEEKKKKRKLIEESNKLSLLEPDYAGEINKMMNNRAVFDRGRQFQAEYDHRYRRKRTGWGPWRNETRDQIQPRVERACINMINRELSLAEEEDKKPFQTNFFQQIDK